MITHDRQRMEAYADTVWLLEEGKIETDKRLLCAERHFKKGKGIGIWRCLNMHLCKGLLL